MKIRQYKDKVEKPVDYSEENLGFGKVFTDHMFEMDYDEINGWHDARIVRYHSFSLRPECMVFHYAQEIFEGLKVYRCEDGSLNMFRIDANAKRFYDSAIRMGIPPIEEKDFIEACTALAKREKRWVPYRPGNSLYLRPFIIATDNGLGVHAAHTYGFYIIASPSGAYFKTGLEPVRIYVEDEEIRSAPGLTGFAKCGGNYAISIKAGEYAKKNGFNQVLWLDGVEHRYVEEVGSMNIFFKIEGKLYTAACTGTVLPGVTRSSVIRLCEEYGYEVIEGKLAIDEIMEKGRQGKVEEIFGTGTAAVISPVGELYYKGESIIVNDMKTGKLSQRLFDELTGIQWGRIPDINNWVYKIS